MQKKFRVLRFIGTVWKVLAWIELILGILAAAGVLLFGIFGVGALQLPEYQYPYRELPWQFAGPIAGIVGFFASLIAVVIYFLMLYAVGELIFLLIAIEENTRTDAQRMEQLRQSMTFDATPSGYYSPPPSAPTQQ